MCHWDEFSGFSQNWFWTPQGVVLSRYIGPKPRHHFWDFSWYQPPWQVFSLLEIIVQLHNRQHRLHQKITIHIDDDLLQKLNVYSLYNFFSLLETRVQWHVRYIKRLQCNRSNQLRYQTVKAHYWLVYFTKKSIDLNLWPKDGDWYAIKIYKEFCQNLQHIKT